MFSLRSLLLIVAVAALGTAALIYRTPYWISAVVTLTVSVFMFGLLRVYTNPEKRPFWIPALIIGVAYCSVAIATPWPFRSQLLTSRLLYDWWYEIKQHEFANTVAPTIRKEYIYRTELDAEAARWRQSVSGLMLHGDFILFRTVAHCLIGLALATIIGALYSWSVTRKKGGT